MTVYMVVAVAVSANEERCNLPTIKMMLIGSDIHHQPVESIVERLEGLARRDHQTRYGFANTIVTSRIESVSTEYLSELSNCADSRADIFKATEASRT